MPHNIVEQDQEQELKTQALTIVEKSSSLIISDQMSYDSACDLLLHQIKPIRKRWALYWDELKRPAYESYKMILHKFAEGDQPLELAERQVKKAIADWDFEKQLELQRLQREAEAKVRNQEEENRANAAAVAEDMGATEEEVEAIVSTPVAVVAPPVQPTYQKAAGVSVKESWSARVTDIKKLCAAIAKGAVPVSYVEPNMVALNQRARADRGTLNLPGVIAVKDSIVSGRM